MSNADEDTMNEVASGKSCSEKVQVFRDGDPRTDFSARLTMRIGKPCASRILGSCMSDLCNSAVKGR